ncbi:MAG: bifunctional pyr operon transcriptional regulator/uracil phosphoribosyltransferase PyrR [Pseudomonadota bacterium]
MTTPSDAAAPGRPKQGRAPSGGSAAHEVASVGALLDAEALYLELLKGVRAIHTADTQLVGIHSGGFWLAERVQRDLGLNGAPGSISSAMHRDDFAQRGLSDGGQTQLTFDVNGADILLFDDVLYTGRTIRAALNELFDYGRPARVRLAVLVDRGGRELPVQADVVADTIALHAAQSLELLRDGAGRFSLRVEKAI